MPKKVFCGVVTNAESDKTVKVSVLQVYKDRLYKKVIKKYKKYTAHDENNSCKKGDRVLIQEHKPISVTKKWVVING
ncbi:30S ribosomal protein S17 [Wolbachia endosymbiont of Drosophila simulans wNo]|uniref:30S ribosomal protein S17 n=1 Tax=Wolbachia TaxID=953 RepID=UPI0002D24F0A|nr:MULTISPECIES: 30S ribosomal protein S17 [Wolbachia]AGJ99224.1 30S ribosomal protein S17 [Wolbachia endosymbiont of Drosophila simulans wNo]QCB62359.1 30S ribosomal protein S17 [Wolbachia endosymbiont of Drosophila mauritiana]QCB63407.1 30S ribosomal protein S17 [Wolbachia endosymbiont of Drosophila mauritiana]QWE33328.1 30S ribosomal protein S17 [Wolbachia endosymbiont of Drosophila simulans]TGB06756.1 30S ribosomal protein S17 [Wolbachia endosymbiont of Drosophila mauritiana]